MANADQEKMTKMGKFALQAKIGEIEQKIKSQSRLGLEMVSPAGRIRSSRGDPEAGDVRQRCPQDAFGAVLL